MRYDIFFGIYVVLAILVYGLAPAPTRSATLLRGIVGRQSRRPPLHVWLLLPPLGLDGDLVVTHQYLLIRSSFEAELVALDGATADLTWIKNLLLDFGIRTPTISVYLDNETTIRQVSEHAIQAHPSHRRALLLDMRVPS